MNITEDIAKGFTPWLEKKLEVRDFKLMLKLFKFIADVAEDDEETKGFKEEMLPLLEQMRSNFVYNVDETIKLIKETK